MNIFKVHPWLNDICLYAYTTFCLFINKLMDIWLASTCWLPWIILLWTIVHKFLRRRVLISFGYIFWVYLLGHVASLCSYFWEETAKLDFKEPVQFYSTTREMWGWFSASLSTQIIVFLFTTTILVSVKWCLIVLWFAFL